MGRIREPLAYRQNDARQREAFDLQVEAWKLLALVGAEFASDPMATQCFDKRVVVRVLSALEKRKELEAGGHVGRVLTGDDYGLSGVRHGAL